jgi:hypothetical protein
VEFREAHDYVCLGGGRIKIANGGNINYVKDNKEKNFNANSSKA